MTASPRALTVSVLATVLACVVVVTAWPTAESDEQCRAASHAVHADCAANAKCQACIVQCPPDEFYFDRDIINCISACARKTNDSAIVKLTDNLIYAIGTTCNGQLSTYSYRSRQSNALTAAFHSHDPAIAVQHAEGRVRPIDRIKSTDLTVQEFLERYARADIPVIITDCSDNWDAINITEFMGDMNSIHTTQAILGKNSEIAHAFKFPWTDVLDFDRKSSRTWLGNATAQFLH